MLHSTTCGFSGACLIFNFACLIPWQACMAQTPANHQTDAPAPFSYQSLCQQAKREASQPYIAARKTPPALAKLSYDEYRHLQFRREAAIWGNQNRPFWLEFFHKGFVQTTDVQVHQIEDGVARQTPYRRDMFHYWGGLDKLELPPDLGFAGLRVAGRYPGRTDGEEMLTFLGASYFRTRAQQHIYGASARGLAVNIGTAGDEEFPAFHNVWVRKPAEDDTTLEMFALLSGPSVSGAYAFRFKPGLTQSTMDVRSTLYFRKQPEKVGIAPITSMWMWGAGQPGPDEDPRPEVHDSDGLLIHDAASDAQWRLRSLNRLTYPSVMRYPVKQLKGFGLFQRDRDPRSYLDNEAKYHRRPSIWVSPANDWGAGSVELFELPAPHEGRDNIAAYWVPDEALKPGREYQFNYQLKFFAGHPAAHCLAKVIDFQVKRRSQGELELDVLFAGQQLPAVKENAEGQPAISTRLTTVRGKVIHQQVTPAGKGRTRVQLRLEPLEKAPLEIELTLVDPQGAALSETWSYLCPVEASPVNLPPWRLRELGRSDEISEEDFR